MKSARKLLKPLVNSLTGPHSLAFVPALTLGSYWIGGEGALIALALAIPAVFAIAGLYSGTGPAWSGPRDSQTALPLRSTAEKALAQHLAAEASTGLTTAALALAIDDFEHLERQFGTKSTSQILFQTGERLQQSLRDNDCAARLDGPRFAVVLGPVRRADLEIMIQLSARLQAAVSEPYVVNSTRVYMTASVGFCLPGRAAARTGQAVLKCAEDALEVAVGNGASSIREYTPRTKRRIARGQIVQSDVAGALDNGHILPWFQPQVSTDTGQITGFEALARWDHPDHGIILPATFIPELIIMGLQERLCQIILSQSLGALRDWDRLGFDIPNISVNFSSEELSNPKLCQNVMWELDRFDLSPERLCIEILEDVIAASQNDVIVRSILALAESGCNIDLDDFGTGYASIANIRRYAVNRIKIDRSFITRVDRDHEQQNMVAAILTMAERLDIDTLAEGVETIGEHAILAQLGCGHVQGFSIARPMPGPAVADWISQYHQQQTDAPIIGQKIG